MKLIGPFKQLITMNGLPIKGSLKDEQLEIIPDAGVLTLSGKIVRIGSFDELKSQTESLAEIDFLDKPMVGFPGFIDAHTHICFEGNRSKDYAARNNGKTYLEIAKAGGGIWDTVTQTRKASQEELEFLMEDRITKLFQLGITTVEIKSGYGLSKVDELKMLRAILNVGKRSHMDVISTCLAAHIVPKEMGSEEEYLNSILDELVPKIIEEDLTNRFDIFIEESAFSTSSAKKYLQQLKTLGFKLTVHGDQFTTGGSEVAVECGALSVDHLEASGEKEIEMLAKSETIPVVLPGASFGLGCELAPARKLLNAGCSLAIASDWNPGSAPQGNLLTQASLFGAMEKLSAAEVFAGITVRAAKALDLHDRGKLEKGFNADLIAFPTSDFRDVLYYQGEMKPTKVWKAGLSVL